MCVSSVSINQIIIQIVITRINIIQAHANKSHFSRCMYTPVQKATVLAFYYKTHFQFL